MNRRGSTSRLLKKCSFEAIVTESGAVASLAYIRRRRHARRRPTARSDVQLPVAGTAGSCSPSAATDPADGGGSVAGAFAPVQPDVCRNGPTLDCPGEAAAGAVVADSLQRSERAAADGAVELQLAVPVVCGAE